METIHRTLGDCPLPDVRVCRHLAEGHRPFRLESFKQCANCGGRLCESCEDDAVHCSGGTCVGLICEECQATARKRTVPFFSDWRQGLSGENPQRYDYLCSPCCAKQDAAQTELLHAMDTSAMQGEWLDDIVAKSEEAIEKAKESL
jgi:hypothetical protein